MWSFVAELLLNPSGVVDEVRDGRRERRNRQRARATKIPCALRVVDGTHPGLSRRWRRGAARVPPGALVFDPDSLWRPRMTIPVLSAALQPRRDVPRRSLRERGPQPRRIVLETARATLEWMVPEEQSQRSMGVTGRSVREVRPTGG